MFRRIRLTGRYSAEIRLEASMYDHILHTYQVWQVGAYVTYHHHMFQTGYGTPAVPSHGISDPEFSPYHRQVFEFIALGDRYALQ